jgi:NTP pyrophosphatase (non-canonical NTP hydrolase)
MTFDDYQLASRRTINPELGDGDRLFDAAAGLAEESGEVLAHVRKQRFQHRPLDAARLKEELGDVLWCLSTVASALNLTLGEIASDNLTKLRLRYPDGFSLDRGADTR